MVLHNGGLLSKLYRWMLPFSLEFILASDAVFSVSK